MAEEVSIIRWPAAQPPDEHSLRRKLAEENLSPYSWGTRPATLMPRTGTATTR